MQISIFGLGYVGAVTAGCLARLGHSIIGADVQEAKVQAFNDGISPIIEPELDALLKGARASGHLRATTLADEAVRDSDVSIICVGTPSLESGRLNLDFVRKVSQQIAEALRNLRKRHVVIFRSTMLPGSTRSMVTEVIVKLLGDNAQILPWEGAEMIKYACNYFHAIKVGFANEIGRMSKFLGVDGARVMDVVCKDTKLNISPYYLRPGNPFGGSCLPKDVSALSSFARMEGVSLPLLDNTLSTNQAHLDVLLKLITSKERRKVGLLGLAFKADTDDLRGSPMVAVAEALLGRGYQISVYDPQINLSRLIGANEEMIQRRMPHLAQVLKPTLREVLDASELVVASQKCASVEEVLAGARADQVVIDVNGWRDLAKAAWTYEGLCW